EPESVQPVRPNISNESRSALIEQLKARHSSQHRRIDELSSKLEQTHKSNRRLQTYILLLAVAGTAICAYSFRDRLFPRHIATNAGITLDPGTGKNKKPAPSTTAPAPDNRGASMPATWELKVKKHDPIPLALGKLSANQVVGDSKSDDYAEVAE